jgi:hypothetical protein
MVEEDVRLVEKRRAAATIRATLSSQLITGGLAVLAVEGAFVTYTLDKREGATGFLIIAALSALLIIVSFFLGALAQDALGGNVSEGGGMSRKEHLMFMGQTLFLGTAIVLLPFSFIFFGTPQDDGLNGVVKELNGATIEVESQHGQPQEFTVRIRAPQE